MFICKQHPTYKGIKPPSVKGCHCRRKFVYEHWADKAPQSNTAWIAKQLGISDRMVRKHAEKLGLKPFSVGYVRVEKDISEQIQDDRQIRKDKSEKATSSKKYDFLLKEVERLEAELHALTSLGEVRQTYSIKPNGSCDNEAVAVVVASDWHIEETVRLGQVSGLNEFNASVCEERVARFWRHAVKLIKKEQKSVSLTRAVVALLGDFITGSIHDDLMEGNRLPPALALIEAEDHIIAGLNYLLENTDLEEIIVVCHSGNHGRMTQQQRIATEEGNSLERVMYHHLTVLFRNEPRLKWVVSEGYHSYLTVLNTVIRFHHGHAIKYSGGIGGITIPVNKAIASWNKSKVANLDVFGHYHQFFDGGNFICNGSLIGYNAYALSIKASHEPARQAFFLIDREDGKTVVAPIVLEHDK